LRQLKQRIGLRCHLEPLSLEETSGYINRRLRQAGAGDRSNAIFPTSSSTVIHRYSNGIPRLINTICENALITAFAARSPEVTPEMVEEVAREFRLGMPKENPAPSGLNVPAMAVEHQSVVRALVGLLETLERAAGGRLNGSGFPSSPSQEKGSVIPQ
jgi:hypothetical protein